MRDPVFGRIFCQREAFGDPFVDVTIKMKKISETRLSEDGMGRSGKDLVLRKVSERGCESIRHQKLLYGEVRELDNLRTAVVDD
jgi:hypothetical protein